MSSVRRPHMLSGMGASRAPMKLIQPTIYDPVLPSNVMAFFWYISSKIVLEYIMIPSRPVCCWKKHKKNAIQVDDAYLRSQQAWPKVTPDEVLSDFVYSEVRISSGSYFDRYIFLIKLRASSSFALEIENPIDSSGNIVNKNIKLISWHNYGKP